MITNQLKCFTWKEISKISYHFNEPFLLDISDGQQLCIEKIMRIIPGKRIVALARLNNKVTVAKLFIDRRNAKRQIQKELAGINALSINKIPTPAIQYQGSCKDKDIQILLLEFIANANNLDELWQNKIDIDAVLPVLKDVMVELATQHVLGVIQNDLHLKNFLVTENHIYTLDGAEITVQDPLLPKKASIANLAIFLAQLGVGMRRYQKQLFMHYGKARGWLIKKGDVKLLFELINEHNRKRWQDYQAKIFRECTEFANISGPNYRAVINRNYSSPELVNFVRDPEKIFASETSMLKNGNSTTVIKTQLGERHVVIKRYNLKHFWHWLRRGFRASRAASCWLIGHKMQLFGFKTAKPIAFIETRKWGLRHVSYYVTEYIPGCNASDKFKKASDNPALVHRTTKLIKDLLALNITHGDLKITNILFSDGDIPFLIDLDGAQEHQSVLSLQRKWQKDVNRFLKNFSQQPYLAAEFSASLRKSQGSQSHAIHTQS